MTPKFLSALEVRELLDRLSTGTTDYWAALRLRLINGFVTAYSSQAVMNNGIEQDVSDDCRIQQEAWPLIFEQGGDALLWPASDMSVTFPKPVPRAVECDYMGVYFYYEDLADFLPIEPYKDPPLDPEVRRQFLASQGSNRPPSGLQQGKSRRGPKRSDFWNMMTVEVARRIFVGDLTPPIKASTVRDDLLSWLVERGAEPDRTTVDPFFKDLEKALNKAHFNDLN